MKKIYLTVVLLFGICFFSNTYSSYTDTLTISQNGYCIESSHIGTNDCNKAFDGIFSNNNYYQNDTGTGNYVGFHFYTSQYITRYSIVNTDNDPTFFLKKFSFQALTSTGWVTLDSQTNYTAILGKFAYFNINAPILANDYRIIFNETGLIGILLTEVGLYGDNNTTISNTDYNKPIFSTNDLDELIIFQIVIGWLIMILYNLIIPLQGKS